MSWSLVPHPLAGQVPDSLVGVIMDFSWEAERLHGLALAAESMPVAGLAWHLGLPFWRGPDGRVFSVSPNEVRSDPLRFREQYQRTMRADLSYPIHVVDPAGRWVILDGIHRLLKAVLLGWETIPVKKLRPHQLTEIAVRG